MIAVKEMENIVRGSVGLVAASIGWLSPIHSLLVCALVFVTIDFITGVAASYKRAQRAGLKWGFESGKAWATVYKLFFIMAGIVLAWLIDTHILDFLHLRLANLFTGFVCGVEFWSYLENAAEISDHPIFKWLGKYMSDKLEDAIDADFDEKENTSDKTEKS